MSVALAAKILAALPQTQCTRCGYPDCAAYAQAVSQSDAGINQCPPGGAQGVQWLAAITGQPIVALNPAHGEETPRPVMFIDEDWCIGCTLCVTACPTDAIVGSNKLMHTVIEAYCTGCALCLPVCPVDCISMENASGTATGWAAWSQSQADQARIRYQLNSDRRKQSIEDDDKMLEQSAPAKLTHQPDPGPHADVGLVDRKRAVIEAALSRARAKREAVENTEKNGNQSPPIPAHRSPDRETPPD